MRIERIHAAECRLPLPQPIRLGPVEITTRDFVVLRLEADTGLVGDALSYPRGSSLLDSVRRLAPLVLGSDVALRRATIDGALQNFVNGRPAFVKAASLFDIALWDLAAKVADQPLYQMLGACRHRVPVMVVAGYYLDQRTLADVCDEVRARVDEGYGRIKIMISGSDLAFDERLVAACHKIAGDRLSVDAHWAFRSIPEALRTLGRLDRYDLAFIEDPFGPYQGDLSGELQRLLRTPLAYGEDLPDPAAICRAIDRALVLRLDVTTCGGVSTAAWLAEMAGNAGRSVLPHVFLPIHAQIAGSLRVIDAVEYIPIECGACPMFDLLERAPAIKDGILAIDQTPGAGMSLDWSVVDHTCSRDRFTLAV